MLVENIPDGRRWRVAEQQVQEKISLTKLTLAVLLHYNVTLIVQGQIYQLHCTYDASPRVIMKRKTTGQGTPPLFEVQHRTD